MKIGDVKNFAPTAWTSSPLMDDGKRRYPNQIKGRIIAINWPHRHFTMEGQINGYTIRETYKFR